MSSHATSATPGFRLLVFGKRTVDGLEFVILIFAHGSGSCFNKNVSRNSNPTVANYREFKEYPKIVAAVSCILARKRFVAPVELFVEMGLLLPADLERWKRGQVPALERVIRCNFTRCGRILRLLRFHAHDLNLGPSITVYHHSKQRLRFSRSGEPKIEEAWSRHFVIIGKRNPIAPPETEAGSGGP